MRSLKLCTSSKEGFWTTSFGFMSPVRFDLDLQGPVMYLLMNLPASTMPHSWLSGTSSKGSVFLLWSYWFAPLLKRTVTEVGAWGQILKGGAADHRHSSQIQQRGCRGQLRMLAHAAYLTLLHSARRGLFFIFWSVVITSEATNDRPWDILKWWCFVSVPCLWKIMTHFICGLSTWD